MGALIDVTPTIKLAANDHPILHLLRRRWSGRAVDSRPVPRATLASLLEAARWAPSGGNGQPWAFLIFDGNDASARADAEACLNEGNAWAKRAPVLILSVAREVRTDGKPAPTARHDLGLATENLLLQANALGLLAHAMGGFDHAEAQRRFQLPEGCAPMAMIAVGYPGDLATLEEKHRAQAAEARTRKPIPEIAFAGRWGTGWQPAG